MATCSVQDVIRRHKVAIADAARNDETLLCATETAAKLAQLTFSQVRRSARANRQLVCNKNQNSQRLSQTIYSNSAGTGGRADATVHQTEDF